MRLSGHVADVPEDQAVTVDEHDYVATLEADARAAEAALRGES